MEEATLDALKAKHGRVALIHLRDDIEFVLRAPNRAEYRACRSDMHTPGRAPDAQEDLIRKIVVYCSGQDGDTDTAARVAFDKLLNQYPALCENRAASREIAEFTGLEFSAQGKG